MFTNKSPKRLYSIVYFLCPVVLFLLGPKAMAQVVDPDILSEIKAGAINRLERLQRVSVAFKSVVTYRPIMAALPPDVHPDQGSWGYLEKFRFSGDRAEYEWEYDAETVPRAKAARGPTGVLGQKLVYTFERVESLTRRFDDELGFGTISDSRTLPTMHCIEFGLGLRCYQSNEWLAPQSLAKASFSRGEGGTVVIDFEATDMHGHRVDNRWWLDPQKSYALLKYQTFYLGNKRPFFEVLCSDFQGVNGLMLPEVIDEQQHSEYKGAEYRPLEEEMHVLKYEVAAKDNRPESYSLQWPSKSTMKDMRTGVIFKPATTQAISDAQIVARAIRRQTSPVTKGWTGAQIALTAVTALLGIMLALLYIRKSGRKTP